MFRAPVSLPPFDLMLADLGARVPEVARFLDVSQRSVYTWKAAQQAPRPAALALFWESRWGTSLADAMAFNDAQVFRCLVGSLERENAMPHARIARLEALGEFGSANAPRWRSL